MWSMLAHGSGATGFAKSLRKRHKQSHAIKAKTWHSHMDLERSAKGKANVKNWMLHFNLDDPWNDVELPSLSLLARSGHSRHQIENSIPHSQGADGGCAASVSGPFPQACKGCLDKRGCAHDGICMVMNEFGKMLGFCFVNGT
jgi:hypothetical protein